MEMLRGARDPPVTATTTWEEVAPQFEADPRCAAIMEPQRPQMFDTFKDALAQLEAAKAAKERAAAADDFKVRSSSHTTLSMECLLCTLVHTLQENQKQVAI